MPKDSAGCTLCHMKHVATPRQKKPNGSVLPALIAADAAIYIQPGYLSPYI